MTREISNSDDVIDSRDVIARIEELNNEVADGTLDVESKEELLALTSLADEADSTPDWIYGETLIRDSYFEEYARELAEDIGAVKNDATWPYNCIDWKQAARELQVDYFSVDFDGVTYWVRS